MKRLILFLLVLYSYGATGQHSLNWVKQMVPSGSPAGIISQRIAVDAFGNVYTTGQFSGLVDFDPGPGTTYMSTPTGSGGGHIFISKLSATGDFLWAKQFTGTIYMYANALAVSAAGDVYVAGTFNNTVDFDPGPGTAFLTAMSPTDVFVCRLNASGDFVWVKHIGSSNYESVYAMEFAHDGGLLLTGYGDATIDYDPGPSVFNLDAGGFIIKLSESGDLVWGTSLSGLGTAIDVEADGTIIQSGGDMNYITLNKLSASGNLIWSKMFNGGYMSAGDVTHNDAGEIYLSGNFESTLVWGTGSAESLSATDWRDAFIVRFDPSGATLGAWQLEGAGYNDLNCLEFRNGTLTAAGYFSGNTDFDFGSGSVTGNTSPQAYSDIAILTLSPDGTFQCLSTIGGSQPDYPTSMAFTADGKLLITGTVGDTADFDPGAGTKMLYHSANFIAQYQMCGMAAGLEEESLLPELFCQPNPASGMITINAKGEWELQICTIEGKIVKQERLSETQQLDVSDLCNGLYTISLFRGNKNAHQKLVISR